MKTEQYKYLTKAELQEANRRAIKAGCLAIEPEHIEGLSESLRYPVFLALPWERHGWVRCQVGTGTCQGDDYVPVIVDVPNSIYEALGVVESPEEVPQ